MDDYLAKKLVENQKSDIRVVPQPILTSSFLERTLKKETLRISITRSIADQRQIRKYEKVAVVSEVPARSWGIIARKDISTQTQ